MPKLFDYTRPPATVLDARTNACAQAGLIGLMVACVLLRWSAFPHPLAALAGTLSLVALAVGINGQMASPLCGLFLPALALATLARGTREIDLGLGAAVGALRPGRWR